MVAKPHFGSFTFSKSSAKPGICVLEVQWVGLLHLRAGRSFYKGHRSEIRMLLKSQQAAYLLKLTLVKMLGSCNLCFSLLVFSMCLVSVSCISVAQLHHDSALIDDWLAVYMLS